MSDLWRAKLAATEQSPVGTVVTDLDGRIQYASPSFEQLTGYSADELIGKEISVLGRQSTAPDDDLWTTIRAGRVWSGEFESIRKDRSSFWASALISPVHDESGTITHFVGLNEDITERKNTESSLLRSRERYRAMVEALPDMMFRVDSQGRFVDFSPAKGTEPFVRPDEFLGKIAADVLPPDVAQVCDAGVQKAIETGETQTIEYRLGEGASRRDYEASIVSAGGGEAIAVIRDVTDRKRGDAALRSAREELERRTEAVSQPASAYDLTFRELTVLSVMAEGKQDREIAELLGISHRTVQTHVASILKKMKARTRTDASVRAQREGLIA